MRRVLGVLMVTTFAIGYAVAEPTDGTVIAEKANIRGAPTQSGRVYAELSRGTEFALMKQEGAWFLIQTRTEVGWIHGNGVELTNKGMLSDTNVEERVPVRQTTTPTPLYAPSTTTTRSSGYIQVLVADATISTREETRLTFPEVSATEITLIADCQLPATVVQ